jgi:hypothetical protein
MNERTLRRVVVGLGLGLAPGCGAGSADDAAPNPPAPGGSQVEAPAAEIPSGEPNGTPPTTPSGGEAVVPDGVALEPGTVTEGGTAAEGEGDEAPPVEGDIRFSEPSGTFQGTLSVGIETPIEGAEIRYTLDGSAPGPS